MESINCFPQIPCPIHPSQHIQCVNFEINSNQLLYCSECFLQDQKPSVKSQKFLALEELADFAASIYAQQKQEISSKGKIPIEYDELIISKAERLEKLNQHIEIEKEKMNRIFDSITQVFLQKISEKKKECLNALDQQMDNLNNWFTLFEEQITKTYWSEDTPASFLSKEGVIDKLKSFTTARELEEFLNTLKENKKCINLNLKQTIKEEYIYSLSKGLIKIADFKPFIEEAKIEAIDLGTEITSKVEGILNKMMIFRNPISDAPKIQSFDSTFVTDEEFEMIKGWIPKELRFGPKLIYRASRDGFGCSYFHNLCDGKSNTITLIKAQFEGDPEPYTIGGFLDQKWHSNKSYIQSDKSFLFSTTLNIKCPVISPDYAAYGDMYQGPTFGGGHDLTLMFGYNNFQGSLAQYSYSGTAQLVRSKKNNNFMTLFNVLEVEVYTLE